MLSFWPVSNSAIRACRLQSQIKLSFSIKIGKRVNAPRVFVRKQLKTFSPHYVFTINTNAVL